MVQENTPPIKNASPIRNKNHIKNASPVKNKNHIKNKSPIRNIVPTRNVNPIKNKRANKYNNCLTFKDIPIYIRKLSWRNG